MLTYKEWSKNYPFKAKKLFFCLEVALFELILTPFMNVLIINSVSLWQALISSLQVERLCGLERSS